jgi:hypothetical protein
VTWATRLVFSPVVWAGVALAGVSVVLFAVSGAMRARGVGRTEKGTRDKDTQLPSGRSAAPAKSKSAKNDDIEGMDDIEAILRKHGIQ